MVDRTRTTSTQNLHMHWYIHFCVVFFDREGAYTQKSRCNNFDTLWELSESPRSFVFAIWQKKATNNKSMKLSVHWGINPFLKSTTSLFLAKCSPPSSPLNQLIIRGPFLKNPPSLLVFRELPPSNLDFSVNLQNIKVFHRYYHLIF